MSKENLEQFMKQVADSEELQAKIGAEITGDASIGDGNNDPNDVRHRLTSVATT